MSDQQQPDPNGEDQQRPPARNPFDESQPHEPLEKPAIIQTRRSAAVFGVIAGFVILLLVVGICVLGSIAFGS